MLRSVATAAMAPQTEELTPPITIFTPSFSMRLRTRRAALSGFGFGIRHDEFDRPVENLAAEIFQGHFHSCAFQGAWSP
jgi:hypothetical protein